MSEAKTGDDIDFRVSLLERAIADNARRLTDLERALIGANGRAPRAPRSEMVIDADSVAPFAAGFHQREFDNTGRPYRWTGRGDFFELRLRLDRNVEWTFEMDLRGSEHVTLEALRAFVDYSEVPIGFGGSGALIAGAIPAKPPSDLAVLTFHLPVHFIPSRLDPSSPDHRTLSAVFYGLKLRPETASAPTDHESAADR